MNIYRLIFKDRSLPYKFTLVSVAPIVIVTIFMVFLITKELEKSVIDETITKVRVLTSLSVLSMSNPFVIYNKELLDNFIGNLANKKNMLYAMIVDSNDNRILSHSDHQNDGKIFHDSMESNTLTSGDPDSQMVILKKQEKVYEISAPIIIKGVQYGFIRLGFSLEEPYAKIAAKKNKIAAIALIAIILGAFFSILLVRIMSRPIKALAEQSLRIGAGNFRQEITYESKDALGKLAHSFKKMAEDLKMSVEMIQENKTKYQTLFEYSPISLWEDDFSDVKKYLDELHDKGVKDFKLYFEDHPDEISTCISMIKVLDVNRATLKLFEADNKQHFFENLRDLRTEKTHRMLMEEGVIPLVEGRPFEVECVFQTLTGLEITVLVRVTIPPAYRNTWSKAIVSIQDMTELKRSELIEKMFDRYISREVMNTILENPDAIKLGGEKRKVTIMITDLRGFTALSERLDPEQVVQLLNNYFEVVVDVALQYNGTINEITGDSLLVIFGAPQKMPDRAQRAIACAIAMQNIMAEVKKQNLANNLPHLEMGIGLNEAEVILGNIGSKKRSKYGVVGSGVNMTSRIESYTVGGQILISESVRKAVADIIRIDNQMEVHPKGVDMPFTVYEVGGISGPYNLTLEDRTSRFLTLAREITVRYTVLDGKYMGRGNFPGAIIRLTRKSCELRLMTPLEPLTNIKMNLSDVSEDLAHRDFYGKILECSGTETSICKINFTALPPGIDGYFQAILTQGASKENISQ